MTTTTPPTTIADAVAEVEARHERWARLNRDFLRDAGHLDDDQRHAAHLDIVEAAKLTHAAGYATNMLVTFAEGQGQDVGDCRARLDVLGPWVIAEHFAYVAAPAGPSVDGTAIDTEDDPEGWPRAGAADIAAVLSGSWEPPTPTILRRSDGAALLYPGKVHSLSGEPGAAKTWIALAAISEVLAGGGRAMLLDHEDRLDTAVRRLVAIGCPPEAVIDRFDYRTPTFAIKGGGVPTNVLEAAASCELVAIDSLGEALAHSQLNQNDDGEVASYMAQAARRLADGGACVLLLDHVVKNTESRGRWAIGSQRKLAAIDGAAYTATAIKALSHDSDGLVKITVAKDRGGNYQHGSTVAMVAMTPVDNSVHLSITADDSHPQGGEFMPTVLMERVSRWLEEDATPATANEVADAVTGKRAKVLQALRRLVHLGYVTPAPHTVIRPFREHEMTRNDQSGSPVPTGSPLVPEGSNQGGSPPPSPYGGGNHFEGTRNHPAVPGGSPPEAPPPPDPEPDHL